ncbi:MAG: hypothetical protein GX754_10355 [Clostridiaceae bacterium]|nr:hypothetical protein [Clostridiaceae bacterium]
MDSLTITILAIILSTIIAGFIRRNAKDKCIKDFKHNNITLLTTENKYVMGRMIVEGTGLEFVFTAEQGEKQVEPAAGITPGDDGSQQDSASGINADSASSTDEDADPGTGLENEAKAITLSLSDLAAGIEAGKGLSSKKPGKLYSYILYKTEFARIAALIRYHKNLSDKDKIARKVDIERTYHPSRPRRIKRRFMNMLKMLKDSLMEIFSTITGHLSKQNISQKITAAEIGQTTKVQKEIINTIDAAYDPLLEKYIGNHVIVEFNLNDTPVVLKGILKEYTSEFIELLDILIKTELDDAETPADIIIPRKLAIIRGVGEKSEKSWRKNMKTRSR